MRPPVDIALVGPVPPPRGGISVHLDRLGRLVEANGFSVVILNHFADSEDPRVIATLRRNPLRYLFAMRRLHARAVHYHHARWSTLVAAAVACNRRGGTWIATFHGPEIEAQLLSRIPLLRRLSCWAIGRFDEVIAVSESLAELVTASTGRDVTVIPAYIPPPDKALPVEPLLASLPRRLVVSAYSVATSAGRDTYGLDLAVRVFIALAASHPRLELEVYLSQPAQGWLARRYIRQLERQLRRASVYGRVRWHVGVDLVPAFCRGAIYLRPTRTDGDAVSVREALDAGIPTVASDAVARPAGVKLVPAADEDAWVRAVAPLLLDWPEVDGRPGSEPEPAQAMLSMYRRVCGRPARPHPAVVPIVEPTP